MFNLSHFESYPVGTTIALLVGFAFIQNINNFVLAAVTRLRKHTIPLRLNLLIAVLSAAATGIAVVVGSLLRSQALRMGFDAFVEVAARGTLVAIGCYLLAGYIRKRLKNRNGLATFIEDHSHSRECDLLDSGAELKFGKAIVLGLLMASDNLGISSIFGLLSPLRGSCLPAALMLAVLTGLFSFIAVALGQMSADGTRRRLMLVPQEVYSLELISSVLIILLGVYDPAGLIVSFGAMR